MSDTPAQEPQGQPQAPAPGTPEHDAAMAAKYTASQQPPAPEGELIAGKFKTVDDLVNAYKSLETKLGQPKADPAPATDAPITVKTEAAPEGAAPPAAVDLFSKAEAAYAETGDIPAELRGELAKVGITDQFIDRYLAGVKAQEAEVRNAAFSLTGGEENFRAMQEWIKTLPQAEIDKYNAAVVDPKAWELAIQGMYAKFTAANGSEGGLVTTETGETSPAGDVYRSKAELTEAMGDPRYAKDAAYRADVAAKLARSRAAGTLPTISVAL